MKAIYNLKFLLPAFLLLFASPVFAQTPNSYSLLDNLQPTSPTAWQFTKYTDLPVSEYTGLPNISIPLYQIDVDGVKLPLNLTYYAIGNKVNEEASWVGLGWDLTVGSIVQTVNSKDDYSTDSGPYPYTKFLPDWPGSPETTQLPYRYAYPLTGPSNPGQGWYTPYPGSTPPSTQAYQAFEIATDYYIPINTNFDTRALTQFTSPTYDWEPDVFKANFLGHSINFILDWSNNQIVVLNKKGYKVTRNSDDTWSIIVPTGEEYDFQQKDAVQTSSAGQTFYGSTSSTGLSSKIWMLTKIITKNKKQIVLNYSVTGANTSYPSYTQKLMKGASNGPSTIIQNQQAFFNAYSNMALGPTMGNYYAYDFSVSTEADTYLSSITFPNGQINFSTSARQDMNGAMKLDNISINTNQVVKSYTFNYGYLNSTSVGGNKFKVGDTTIYNSTANYYRLQLQSLTDNSGATHTFTYNSTPLPSKNSFATDVWGFYNGQLTNTSLVPNPSRYNITTFGNTGDNHSANVTYAQAGILTRIQYPTGGSVNFGYELNAFDNYFVPDFSTTTNTISHGNGLRIQSVTFKAADGTQLKKDVYTYSTGKAVLPVSMLRTYQGSVLTIRSDNTGQVDYYLINEFNASGLFSPDLLGSITGVGYDMVSHQEMDVNGNTIGITTSGYYNNPDVVNNSASGASQLSATLPAIKNYATPDNGTLKYQLVYDNNSHLLEKNIYGYTTLKSPLYYGARAFGYTNYCTYSAILGSFVWNNYDQHMVGYYPLFDLETLMLSDNQTEYFGTDSLASNVTYTYDAYNQVASTTKTNSTYNETTTFTYPYNYPHSTLLTSMTTANRLSDIVSVVKNQPQGATSLSRGYRSLGKLFVASADTSWTNLAYAPEYTVYDQYDPQNGNILQYTKNTVPNSFLWDYNKEYVIAGAKNALLTNIAYTSFEADGAGRWKFTGVPIPDPAAPTGQKVYNLTRGNVYRDSLDATKTYIVSYWSKNGQQMVSGTSATKQGYTFNGYTYFEHNVPAPASGTITVSGTGTIDELRLYPNTAQMTTYTYAPLVGITSESNPAGRIAYYEYDNAMRLLDIRDQNKNIIKAYCYNYAGQPTNCGVNVVYTNAAQSVPFMPHCPAGDTSGMVNYPIAAAKYSSTMSQADADNQATEDVNANGQAYANANGNCVPFINFTLNNSTADGYQVYFSNPSYGITYTFKSPYPQTIRVPAGQYTVDVEPTGAYHNHTFILGQQPPVSGVPRAYFYNINIASGSTDSSLSIQP